MEAHILLGRSIDANDNMYIETDAVDEKQCPLFVKCFGECVPLFVICPFLKLAHAVGKRSRNFLTGTCTQVTIR